MMTQAQKEKERGRETDRKRERERNTDNTHPRRGHLAGGSVYCHVQQIDNKVTITPAAQADGRLTVEQTDRRREREMNTNDQLNKLLFNGLICYLSCFVISCQAKVAGTESTSDEEEISFSFLTAVMSFQLMMER